MMQQLATQKPEVAALPIDVPATASAQTGNQGDAFASLMREQQGKQASDGKPSSASGELKKVGTNTPPTQDKATHPPRESEVQDDTDVVIAKGKNDGAEHDQKALSEKADLGDDAKSPQPDENGHTLPANTHGDEEHQKPATLQGAYDDLITQVDETLIEANEDGVDWVNLVEKVQKITELSVTPKAKTTEPVETEKEIAPGYFITPIKERLDDVQPDSGKSEADAGTAELMRQLAALMKSGNSGDESSQLTEQSTDTPSKSMIARSVKDALAAMSSDEATITSVAASGDEASKQDSIATIVSAMLDALRKEQHNAAESDDSTVQLQPGTDTETQISGDVSVSENILQTMVSGATAVKPAGAQDMSALPPLEAAKQTDNETITPVDMSELDNQLMADVLTDMVAQRITKDEQPAKPSDVLTTPTDITRKSDSSGTTESAAGTNNELVVLANLSESGLEKAVNNIASRLLPDSADKNAFVAALQAGVKEFKAQLEQGREPGIDLKQLVSQATEKVSAETAQALMQPAIDKRIQESAQVLNFAQQAVRTADAQTEVAANIRLSEVNQLQSESSRAALNSQQAVDKAINITKSEGHQQLAEKVRWMVNSRVQQADIRIDPPELGAMKIKVNLSGEAASISFTVQSVQARDALEQAIPRLRDMLSEQGIELGQSDIQHQQQGHSETDADGGQFAGQSGDRQSEDSEDINVVSHQQRIVNGRVGGIDYYV
ncbi:flagellar hook-length control protein FliK [Aestuariibacter salexigens]|uniref:flagellar hook-length control protein FliK n=1 Tax=Aestuariibacter salexigens TaxID=226010 RepID=UPI0003FBFF0E|nr:flagellar hook-length control protein FliK [Aestuariibacter salexigens]